MPPALGKRPRSAGVRGSGDTCVHGRRQGGYFCKECPGKGICEHGRERPKCKECGGCQICEHGRRRSQCKECGGSQICEHGRRRSQCKECVRSPRIRVGAVEALTETKVEVKEEPEDVDDPGSSLTSTLASVGASTAPMRIGGERTHSLHWGRRLPCSQI